MATTRGRVPQENVELITRIFDQCIKAFQEAPPFNRYGQFEFHQRTIKRRRKLGSATAAVNDPEFQESLYETLKAWDIGKRGSKLLPFKDFAAALGSNVEQVAELDGLRIESPKLDVKRETTRIWSLIESLGIVDNNAKLVAGSKALHHVLPDLVVPIDRGYTQPFFGWHNPQFQYGQDRCFREAFAAFVLIARAVNPARYVGAGWNTSSTKVIDNAVVGLFVLSRRLAAQPT